MNFIKYTITQTIFSDSFTQNNNFCNLCWKYDFVIPQVKTVLKGSNSIRCYGPVAWGLVPEEIRYTGCPEKFKNKIRRSKPNHCQCHNLKITPPMLDF